MAKKKTDEKKKREKIVESEKILDEDDDEELEYDDEEIGDSLSKNVKTKNKIEIDIDQKIKYIIIATSIISVVVIITFVMSLIALIKVSDIKTDDDSATSSENTSNDDSDENSDWDVSMFNAIDADDMLDILNKNDDEVYFVNVGRSDCAFSIQFLPSLQQSVEEYDYTLNYLSTSKLSEKIDEIRKKDDAFSDDDTYLGSTPMVYAIKNGKVIDVNAGATEYDEYTSFLEEHGVDKK